MTTSCPQCAREIRVPDGVAVDVHVQCPLCHAKYRLTEQMISPPPLLIVLNDVDSAVTEAETFAEDKTIDVKVHPSEPSETPSSADLRPSFNFATADPPATPASKAVATRPTRKKKNILVELVKITLGGVAGIFIALMIMLWILGNDPFNVGPLLPTAIVPERFRGPAKHDDRERPEAVQDAQKRGAPTAASHPAEVEDVGVAVDHGDRLDREEQTANSASSGLPETGAIRPRGAPVYSASDVTEALSTASSVNRKWESEYKRDRSDRKQFSRKFYEEVCKAAEIVTYMDPQRLTSGDLLEPWKELAQQIGQDQSRLRLISVVVAGWIAKKDRGQSGVLVVGKIQRLQRGKDLLIA